MKVIFPDAGVIKLLLECGINVNAKNEVKSTPLHIAAQPYNFNNEVIVYILLYSFLSNTLRIKERSFVVESTM